MASDKQKTTLTATDKVTLETGHSPWAHAKILVEQNRDQIGSDKRFKSEKELYESVLQFLLKNNSYVDRTGNVYTCDDHKTGKKYSGPLKYKGEELLIPKGFKFDDSEKCLMVDVNLEKATPTAATLPEPVTVAPEPPAATLELLNPVEFARQSTPSSDGPKWRPGTESHALELLARSGVDPTFTKWYYALDQVAAREPVTTAANSGQLAGKVNGNETGDFLYEGPHIGENSQSRKDNKSSKGRRATTGNGGFIGQAITGPRQHGFVTGHIARIEPNGTMDRAKSMPIEFAHAYEDPTTGAKTKYAFSLFGMIVPTGDMLGLPVGAIKSSPQKQTVLPADTNRWGIDQAVHVMNRLNEGGWKGALRDEQAKITSPFETPDRVYAKMFGDNAANIFAESMKAAEATKDPAARTAAATQALIAWRDISNNAMVRRVDSLKIPMDEARKGIEAHLASLGVEVDKLRSVVAKAPPLEVRDMPQSLKDQLQDSKALANSRYANIKPGQTNEAYKSAVPYVYRTMNSFELDLALARATEMKEEQIIAASRDVWQSANNHESAKAIGLIMTTNRQVAGKIGFLLHDVDRNYQNYGFKSHDEARAFTDRLVGDDKAVRNQIYKKGRTTPLPVIGRDESYAVTNPELIGTAIGAKIQTNPALFNELMDRATNPAFGRDSKGRSDGRRYGYGLLRELGAQMLPADAKAKEGDLPPDYKIFEATLADDATKDKLYSTVLAAVSYGESGASGIRSNAAQELDILCRTAQEAQRDGTAVISDATTDEQRAALTKGKTGTVTVFNTGGVDGRGVFEASRRGDADGVLTGLVRTKEAREAGRDQAIVRGLTAHPALARDAVLVTVLRAPDVFNDVVKELRRRDRSIRGDRYGALANALEEVREDALHFKKSGNVKDRDAAVQHLGKFFSRMAEKEGKNSSAQRFAAWNGLIDIIGNDANASAWLVDTVAKDAGLRDGLLASVPDAILTLDGARPSQTAGVKGQKFGVDLSGDDVYVSRFFTLPTDSKGKARSGKVSVNAGELAAALAQHTTPAVPPAGTKPAVSATLGGKLNEADTASLKAALSGATVEERTSALRGWIAEHQAGAPGAHTGLVINGELTAGQRDALLAAATKGDTADARLAGFTAALNSVAVAGVKPAAPSTATPVDPSVAAITSSLVKAGVTTPTALGHALNTNPVIVLGTNPQQNPVAGLATWLAGQQAELTAGQTYPQLAAAIIDAGLVKVVTEPGKLAVTPNSENLAATLANGSQLSVGAGVLSKKLLLLLLTAGGSGPVADPSLFNGMLGQCFAPNGAPRIGTFGCIPGGGSFIPSVG